MAGRHRKYYHKYSNGVSLRCGNDTVVSNTDKTANWQLSNCPGCGMEVQTFGNSPEKDKIQEQKR